MTTIRSTTMVRAQPRPGLREYIVPRDLAGSYICGIDIASCHPLPPKYLPGRIRKTPESFTAYQLTWLRKPGRCEVTVRLPGFPQHQRGPPDPTLTELLFALDGPLDYLSFPGVYVPGQARDLANWVYAPHGPWETLDAITARESFRPDPGSARDWYISKERRDSHINNFLQRLPYFPGTQIRLTYSVPERKSLSD
jgi:hypothetical protein